MNSCILRNWRLPGGKKPTYEELEKQVRELSEAICERKPLVEEFRQGEERFRNLIEGSIRGILIHRDHKPQFLNDKWANIHGYSQEEVLSMNTVVQLISPKDQKRMIEFKEARLQGKGAPMDYYPILKFRLRAMDPPYHHDAHLNLLVGRKSITNRSKPAKGSFMSPQGNCAGLRGSTAIWSLALCKTFKVSKSYLTNQMPSNRNF